VKTRLLEFIDCLRRAGVPVSPAETLDASRALSILGVEQLDFREALGATLVKDGADRAIFDEEFVRFFSVPGNPAVKRRSTRASSNGERAGSTSQEEPERSGRSRTSRSEERDNPAGQDHVDRQERSEHQRMRYLRSLQDMPLAVMTSDQIDDCDALLRRIAERLRARQRRRQRAARRGRLDLRRTLRVSVASGGVPMAPEFRNRRPGKSDLVALCDFSHSVATTSHFLLSLVSGAPLLFRRVRLFAFVDSPVESWIQNGHVVHEQALDLYGRSDFGKVLGRFWAAHASLLTRNTLLLILGDARNNRRPARADLLARMNATVQRLIWLNPEPRTRWNTGDSAMKAYAPYCAHVLAAGTLRELYLALKAVVD